VTVASQAPRWRDRWFTQRDRLLTNPRFREAASRFAVTRPVARRHARDLFDLVAGFVYSQWLFACVELRLFDRLAQDPMTAEKLAFESKLPALAAERLTQEVEVPGDGVRPVRAAGPCQRLPARRG